MEEFLDSLNDYIIILDENFDIVFCNSSLLNKIEINKLDINKLVLDSFSEEEIKISLNDNIKFETILKFFIKEEKVKYIRIECKVIKYITSNKIYYHIVGYEIEKSSFAVVKGNANENVKKECINSNKIIKLLEDAKQKIKNGVCIEEIIKDVNIEEQIDIFINEIYKNELAQKDFALFLKLSADLIGSIDTNGNIISVDKAWTKSLGWQFEDLLEQNILDFIYENHKNNFGEKLKNINTSVSSIECKFKCKDNKYKWFRFNIRLVKEINFIAISGRDISLEKQEESIVKKLEKEIQLENLKNQFFANLSHEFKTPLNIILGTSQLIDMNIDKKNIFYKEDIQFDNHIKLIKQNSYRLLRLVNNLIDMSKIDSGFYKLNLSNNNIVYVVEEISLSVASYAKEKGINLIFDTDCEELILSCDPDKIERILLNLLSNSIKNTHYGGQIYVSLKSNEEKVIISVSDNGKGIPKNKLENIFNRFEQVDNLLNRRYEGSGIGLSLVQSLVKMHGGNIKVESEVGVGTKFEFDIINKLISSDEEYSNIYKISSDKIEKCNIEFSDIYK